MLAENFVEVEATHTDAECLFRNNCGLWGFPIQHPLINFGHRQIAVSEVDDSICNIRNTGLKGKANSIIYDSNNYTLEERNEKIDKGIENSSIYVYL